MKPLRLAAALFASLALAAPPAIADERAREVETFMAEYLRLWNAGDAAAITARIYRLDDKTNPWNTAEGLAAEFKRLRDQGYDHSATISIESCLLTKDTAVTELRYSRLKTDGTVMPPKDRDSLYFARKFPDGWRITRYIAVSPTSNLNCTSATE